ncbi:hypothetical protein Bca101_075430 [Brassica carinata]
MYFSEQGIAAILEANKKDNAEKVDEKARLRWSSDLHACFVKAVEKLGGPDKATPKAVKDTMEVEGIALHHVKSHLQKFRLGRCNIRDETDQYHKRMFSAIALSFRFYVFFFGYRTGRRFFKAHAASNSPRPQVNIRPKVMGDVKPKKAKEDHGSLYMRIEFPQETKNTFSMYDPQHVNTSTQEKRQFNKSLNYNMTQGFINPYVTTEPQSMPGSSTVTTQPELQLNDDFLIHDLYRNPSFLPTSVPQTVDSLHQVISNITSPLSTAPQPIQTYAPNHTYNYPEYNTLERVKAQLSALQYSSTSRIQVTPFCETNLSSSVTRDDEEDPVDMYIDWGKYEEVDIDELDPVEALLALGF